MSSSENPFDHVPDDARRQYEEESRQQPGESHAAWAARAARLEAELLGKHPKPSSEAPPEDQVAPVASGVPDEPVE